MAKQKRRAMVRQISPSDDPELLLSIPEARQVLPLSEPTFRRYLATKKLKAYRAGSRVFVKLRDVLRLAQPA